MAEISFGMHVSTKFIWLYYSKYFLFNSAPNIVYLTLCVCTMLYQLLQPHTEAKFCSARLVIYGSSSNFSSNKLLNYSSPSQIPQEWELNFCKELICKGHTLTNRWQFCVWQNTAQHTHIFLLTPLSRLGWNAIFCSDFLIKR